MPPVPIAFQTYQARSLPVSAQRLINFYPEKQPDGARGALALYGTPGLTSFATVTGAGVAQLIPFKSTLLAYAGNTLSSVSSIGFSTVIGEIPGEGPSFYAVAGDYVTFVRDGQGWTYGTPTYQFDTSAYDSVVPLLIGTTPELNATNVLRTTDITLGFNKRVVRGSGQMKVYRLDTNALVATIDASTVSIVETVAMCPTGVTLPANTELYVTAPDGFIQDAGGGRWSGITNNQDLRFKTTNSADVAAPVLQTVAPVGGSEVPSGTPIYFYFDERIQAGTGDVTVTNLNTGYPQTIPIASCTFTRSVLSIPASTQPGQQYQVSIPNGAIQDITGNSFGGTSLLFATLPADGRPRVLSITNEGPRGPLVMEFDRSMAYTGGEILLRLQNTTSTLGVTTTVSGSRVTLSYSGTETGQNYDLLIAPGALRSIYGDYPLFPGFGTPQLLQVVDSDFLPPSTVTSLDGYAIFTRQGDSGEWFISQMNDPQDYGALDFATAETSSDPLVAAFTDHRELWLFGTQSTEIFYNSGNADFPFERVSGANLEKGCIAPQSIAKMDNRIFWVGQEATGGGPIVYVAEGYSPRVVSTPPIAKWLQEGDAANCSAFVYVQDNHTFYCLTVPPRNAETPWRTLVFDAAEGLWHERQSGLSGERWRANAYAYVYGKHLVGDWQTGDIYEMSLDVFTDAGGPLASEAIGVYQQIEGNRFVTSRVEVIVNTGDGLTLGQGSDPQIMLSWSDDGGRTYGNEHWRPYGKIGEYLSRVRWHNLGQCPTGTRVYKWRITDPVRRAIIGAYSDVQVGKR